jgi:hypothetical protein
MADPITAMGGIGLAGQAAGGLLGAFGAEQQGSAQAAMYQYKSGIALMQAQVSKQNAEWDIYSGDVSAEEGGLRAAQSIANTKVQQAASGFDVNKGTAASVRASQTAAAQFDQTMTRFNASKAAYGEEVKAASETAESNLDQFSAANAKTAANISAFGSILGGVTGVATKWSQGSQQGIFS